jgi:hypothetical protein
MPRTRLPISCCADGLRYRLPYGTPGLRACSLSCEGIERTFTGPEAVTLPHGSELRVSASGCLPRPGDRRREDWKRGRAWFRPAGQN